MSNNDPRVPRFRTIGKGTRNPRLILQCSACEMDIKELKLTDYIDVTRGYYCEYCDTGTIIKNPEVEG